MNRLFIIETAERTPYWEFMNSEEKLEYLEEFEILYSETRLPSVSEVIRFGGIADYI